ncbi:MAG: InlB B-repeat-containing protein [Acidobacteriota bacterium]
MKNLLFNLFILLFTVFIAACGKDDKSTDPSTNPPSNTTQQYTVEVTVNPVDGGTVTGSGTFNSGVTVTLKAISKTNFKFVKWTENSNSISTESTYLFILSEDRKLVAHFASNNTTAKFTAAATANPPGGGTISGTGTYDSASTVTISAVSNAKYQFLNWTENSATVSLDSNYTFIITKNRTLVANFKSAIQKYTVTAMVSPSNAGSVSGTGTYNSGTSVTLRASSRANYKFLNWTEYSSIVSSDSVYNFIITSDRQLVANFQAATSKYTVNASVNPAGSGSVKGAGNYESGTSVTVTATANQGYQFIEWTENSKSVSKNTSYTFTITGNRTLVANFKSNSLAGKWYGMYSGYDANSKTNIDLMRHLILNQNNTYIDSLFGKPSSEDNYNAYETETGTYSINNSSKTITWNPSVSKRINFNTKQLEEYTRGTHSDAIKITNDEWEFYDNNLGVTYKLRIVK